MPENKKPHKRHYSVTMHTEQTYSYVVEADNIQEARELAEEYAEADADHAADPSYDEGELHFDTAVRMDKDDDSEVDIDEDGYRDNGYAEN